MPPPLCTAPPSPATVPPAFPPPEHPTAVGWGHRIPSVALGWRWALRMGSTGGRRGGGCSLWDLPLLKSAVPTWGGGRGGGCACCVCGATALCLGRGQLWLYPPLLPAGLFWEGGDPNLLRPRAVLCLGGEGGGGRAEVGSQGGGLGSCRPPPHPPPRLGAERVLAVPPPRCRPRKRFALCPPPPEQDQSPPKPPPLPPRPVPPSGLANYGALRSGFTLV